MSSFCPEAEYLGGRVPVWPNEALAGQPLCVEVRLDWKADASGPLPRQWNSEPSGAGQAEVTPAFVPRRSLIASPRKPRSPSTDRFLAGRRCLWSRRLARRIGRLRPLTLPPTHRPNWPTPRRATAVLSGCGGVVDTLRHRLTLQGTDERERIILFHSRSVLIKLGRSCPTKNCSTTSRNASAVSTTCGGTSAKRSSASACSASKDEATPNRTSTRPSSLSCRRAGSKNALRSTTAVLSGWAFTRRYAQPTTGTNGSSPASVPSSRRPNFWPDDFPMSSRPDSASPTPATGGGRSSTSLGTSRGRTCERLAKRLCSAHQGPCFVRTKPSCNSTGPAGGPNTVRASSTVASRTT